MNSEPTKWLLPGILGLLLGLCLAVGVGAAVVGNRVVFLRDMTATVPVLSEENWEPQIAQLLAEHQPRLVVDLLTPRLVRLATTDEKTTAYDYLAQAELQLGHYQIAAGYLELVYEARPSADVLYRLAHAYDLGGDLPHALDYYQRLAASPDLRAANYRQDAQNRIVSIAATLGTRTPPAP